MLNNWYSNNQRCTVMCEKQFKKAKKKKKLVEIHTPLLHDEKDHRKDIHGDAVKKYKISGKINISVKNC